MTDQLIALKTDSELQESVPVKITDWNGQATPVANFNLRDLHHFLKVKTKFATWIKRRIAEYEFVQDVDFIVSQNREAQESVTYKQEKIEYFGTLNMCKELAMVERTERGKEARRYFIECERIAKEQLNRPLPEVEYAPAQLATKAKIKQMDGLMTELTLTREVLEKAVVDDPQLAHDPVIQKYLEERISLDELSKYLQTLKAKACEQVGLIADR